MAAFYMDDNVPTELSDAVHALRHEVLKAQPDVLVAGIVVAFGSIFDVDQIQLGLLSNNLRCPLFGPLVLLFGRLLSLNPASFSR